MRVDYFLYICDMSYIKKAEYIAKYGEEAWKAYTAKRKEYYRQWIEAHPDYNKQYREVNKERISEKDRQYYDANRERCREQDKQYYRDNREHRCEYNRQWREEHPDYDIQHRKQYCSTQYGRANGLKNSYIKFDKKKGYPVDQNIDEDWIVDNILTSQCVYCGDSDWTHLGADRIDNLKGHIPGNCVCACGVCNVERGDKYTVEEFKEYRKTHPRKLGGGIEKSWEIAEQNGVRVIRKKEPSFYLHP